MQRQVHIRLWRVNRLFVWHGFRNLVPKECVCRCISIFRRTLLLHGITPHNGPDIFLYMYKRASKRCKKRISDAFSQRFDPWLMCFATKWCVFTTLCCKIWKVATMISHYRPDGDNRHDVVAIVLVATSAHNAIKKIQRPANRMISVVKLDVVDESGLISLNCGGDVFVNIGRTTVLY